MINIGTNKMTSLQNHFKLIFREKYKKKTINGSSKYASVKIHKYIQDIRLRLSIFWSALYKFSNFVREIDIERLN